MPDKPQSTRVPKIVDVATFHQRFGSDQACLTQLIRLRWGSNLERFQCPDCGCRTGWRPQTRPLVECRDCHRQTSVTAGTVFHRTRTRLSKWFWAIYQVAQDKKGIAAMELAKQISVAYSTAWTMLQKLRAAMFDRTQRYTLQGLVEVDEAYVGGKGEVRRGRGAKNKTPVAVAVELSDHGKPRRIAMGVIPRVDGRSLRRFTVKAVKKGSTLRTDGWSSYQTVARAGYEHEVLKTGGGKAAVKVFPWIHAVIGNMKRMIDGTYHSVAPKHLNRYLAEFTYRANRRWIEEDLFSRLLVAAVDGKPHTYKQLTA